MPRKKGSKNKAPLKKQEEKTAQIATFRLNEQNKTEFYKYLAKARIVLNKPNLTASPFLRWCFDHSKDFLDWEKEKLDKINQLKK